MLNIESHLSELLKAINKYPVFRVLGFLVKHTFGVGETEPN